MYGFFQERQDETLNKTVTNLIKNFEDFLPDMKYYVRIYMFLEFWNTITLYMVVLTVNLVTQQRFLTMLPDFWADMVHNETRHLVFPTTVTCNTALIGISGVSSRPDHVCTMTTNWFNQYSFLLLLVFYCVSIVASTLSLIMFIGLGVFRRCRRYMILRAHITQGYLFPIRFNKLITRLKFRQDLPS